MMTDYSDKLVSAAGAGVEGAGYAPVEIPEFRALPSNDAYNRQVERLYRGALAGIDEDVRAELGDDALASDFAIQDKEGGNYLLGAEYADQLAGGDVWGAASGLIESMDEGEREGALARLNACQTAADGTRLLGELWREKCRKAYREQEALMNARHEALVGNVSELVRAADVSGTSEGWKKFLEDYSKGVWGSKEEAEQMAVSVKRAAEAFGYISRNVLKDYTEMGQKALTEGQSAINALEALEGDEVAEGLFFQAVQDRVQDIKTDERERNSLVKFGRSLWSAKDQLVAGMMGGHFKAFATDEQVEKFNAERERIKERARRAMGRGAAASERTALSGFAPEDEYWEKVYNAAKDSGQVNADGSLRKMTAEERQGAEKLDRFRGKIFSAVQGGYESANVFQKMGRMMPSSLAYLSLLGTAGATASAFTEGLAGRLAEGEDYVGAKQRAMVDATLGSMVEKLAFGSLKPAKWVPGLDWLMSRPMMAKALGGVYGTAAGRIGMGAAVGTVEETFAEPLSGLLLKGVYNAVAADGLEMDGLLEDFEKEVAEMVKPEQLLVTALYGLLLGGASAGGHVKAARDYRTLVERLVGLGVDEGRAAQAARIEDRKEQREAVTGLIEQQVKTDSKGVLDYMAELYPEFQSMDFVENLIEKRKLPRLIPAGEGMVKVQELQEGGEVSEVLLNEDAAMLLVKARMEELTAKETRDFVDYVLGEAMVGSMKKDSKRWTVEEVEEKMNVDYFQRLSRLAGVQLRKKGVKKTDVVPEIHPHLTLGQLVTQGKDWAERMRVLKHDEAKRLGRPLTRKEVAELEEKAVSRANRTFMPQKDGSLRTLLRVSRGGVKAMEALEELTEDNFLRDYVENKRELSFYVDGLRGIEELIGRPGAFLRELENEEDVHSLMDVTEAIGKLVQDKAMADVMKAESRLSAAVRAFLEMLKKWVLKVKALVQMGEMVNAVLTDAELAEKVNPEFRAMVEELARQDVEWMESLQLKEGLEAMRRATKAADSGASATPVMDKAEAEHGEAVRAEEKKKRKRRRKVANDVAIAEAELEGTTASVVVDGEEELEDIKARAVADGTFMKAPNGEPTNLTEKQWLQVRTEAFKRWFGDWEKDPENASKVVDENGEPKVMYHGSPTAGIEEFEPSRALYGTGIFFTDSPEEALDYTGLDYADFEDYTEMDAAATEQGLLYEVFLNIREESRFYKADGDIRHAMAVGPTEIKSATDNVANMTMSMTVDEAREKWEQETEGENPSRMVDFEGLSIDVAKIKTLDDIANAIYNAQPHEYEKAFSAWKENALQVLTKPVLTKLVEGIRKMSPDKVQGALKRGVVTNAAIQKAISQGLLPEPPRRADYPKAKVATDRDKDELMKAKWAYFRKRRIEVLDLIEKNFGEVHRIDESKKSFSTYYYVDRLKIRISDHILPYMTFVPSSLMSVDVWYSDTDSQVVESIKEAWDWVQNTTMCVVGESADNWDEIKDGAFVGRDDGMLRVELDASKAKLKNGRFVSTKRYTVGDLLDFPELMRAYPELRNFPVSIEQTRAGLNGGLRSSALSGRAVDIMLSTRIVKRPGKMLSTLLHEVQHWIQNKEGFARGGNESKAKEAYDRLSYSKYYRERKLLSDLITWLNAPEMALFELDDVRSEIAENEGNEDEIERIVEAFNHSINAYSSAPAAFFMDGMPDYDEVFMEHFRELALPKLKDASEESINEVAEGLRNAADRHAIFKGLEEIAREMEARMAEDADAEAELKRRLLGLSGYELYRRLAGEVEARNVQARRWMNAEERAELPFNETLEHEGEVLTTHNAGVDSEEDGGLADYLANRTTFNVVSALDRESRRYQIREMLNAGLTRAQVRGYFRTLGKMVDEVLEVAEKDGLKEFKEWQQKAVERWTKNGELLPVVLAQKNNGDYPVNFDLGTICVKREMMTLLTDKLVAKGYASRLGVNQIERLKEVMRKWGISTACDVCFVEAKRVRALQSCQQLSFYWNAVRAAAGITGRGRIGHYQETLTAEQEEKLKMMVERPKEALEKLVSKQYRRINVPGKKDTYEDMGIGVGALSGIASCMLQAPALAGRAEVGDFMSMKSLDYLYRNFYATNLRSYLAMAFGSGTAKPLEDYNTFDPLSLKELKTTVKKLFDMGGARVQSFSDFNPMLFMDYYQMVFELAWRGWPLQAYTKVSSFVALFGQTGMKINMSLVPDVLDDVDAKHAGMEQKKDGSWDFAWHKDSFPIETAIKFREDEKMHANVGTVAVGVSDEHILALLRCEYIDYVIPFHRSGMPNAIMIKTGLDKATDYTKVQMTGKYVPTGKKGKMKRVNIAKDGFSFNEAMRRLGDPKAAAEEYLRLCDENGWSPKFEMFRNEPNYYKLLGDYRVYDKHGQYAPQLPLTTQMPDGWQEVLANALGDRIKESEKMKGLLDNEAFMDDVEDVFKETPLEGEVRKVLERKLNQALGGSAKRQKVKTLKATVFDKKLHEAYKKALTDKTDAKKFTSIFKLRKGYVYGFTMDGVLYLKENVYNANTPAHEFTHLWARVAQKVNPDLWAEGVELLRGSVWWNEVKADPLYFMVHNDDNAMASEALARFVGARNENRVQRLTDPKQKSLYEVGIGKRIVAWAKKIWKDVRSLFDKDAGKPLTLVEFSDMVLADLWVDTRNRNFAKYVKKHLGKSDEELQVEMQGVADAFSASMIRLDEEELAEELVADGGGFKANVEFVEKMVSEMRNTLQRLRRLNGKTRSDREDAVAAMGSMVHMAKAVVQYLPQGYRFSVHPYLKRLEVLAEMAASGDIDLTSDMASKDLLNMENADGIDTSKGLDEMVKEYGNVKLTEAIGRIIDRVNEQLRKHAKDRAVAKMHELLERLAPKKDPKSGKLKGGKMSADAYRDLEDVVEALKLTEQQLKNRMAAIQAEMNEAGVDEARREELEDELMLLDVFGDLESMSAEDALNAYEALRVRVWMHRFEWEDVQERRRAAQRAMARRVIDGVGEVGTNEYNERKRKVRPMKRMGNMADMLASAPHVLNALRAYGPLRELADNLIRRANAAGEQVKAWEAERWENLEKLARATMGRSWRLCMDELLAVNNTNVAFDRPVFKRVECRVDKLRELLAMPKKERMAEMKRREKAGGLEAKTVLSERDVEELAAKLRQLEEEGDVPVKVEVKYLERIQHEENLRLSKGEALYAILMFEQPTYTERMIRQGFTFEVIAGLREYIGDGVLDFGYGLRELLEQQGDRVAKVYESVFGVPFPREEKYFAARWDVTEMKGDAADMLLQAMAGTPGAGNGWMKQRVNHDLEFDMTKDALTVFLQATSMTDKWMATQDIVADFKAWTRDREFARAMVKMLGEESYENLKAWIRIIETGGVEDGVRMGTTQDVIGAMHGAGAIALLGAKIQTLLRQLTACFNGLIGAHDISTAEWVQTLVRMKHGDAPMTFERMRDSQFIKNRQNGRESAMSAQAFRSHDTKSSVLEEMLLKSMQPMEWLDARCTAFSLVPVWNVYYAREVANGRSHEVAEHEAWARTIEVANLVSQPVGMLNKSMVLQGRNIFAKLAFYMMSENMTKTSALVSMWKEGHRMAAARGWLVYGAANAAISALLDCLQGDPEEWEESHPLEYLVSILYGPLAGMPGIGEVVSWLGTGLIKGIGHAFDIEELQKARTHAGYARSILDLEGAWKAGQRLTGFLTDDKEHGFAEYTRQVGNLAKTSAVALGWTGTGIGYVATALAVVMNPVDLFARVWRNMEYYSEN